MLEKDPDEKERRAFVRETEELLVRMDWLLTSLLKLSRLDAGVVVFQKEPVDGYDLINAALRPLLIPMELHGSWCRRMSGNRRRQNRRLPNRTPLWSYRGIRAGWRRQFRTS